MKNKFTSEEREKLKSETKRELKFEMRNSSISYSFSTNSGGYDSLIKMMIAGQSNVGKTSILKRYAENSFNPGYKTTIGFENSVRTILNFDTL